MAKLLTDTGFKHQEAGIDWCWMRPQKPKLTAGHDADKVLAHLLGWRNLEIRESAQEKGDPIKMLVGIPPMGEEIKAVPSWSTDKALALGLLVELGERSGFDYQWWKFGGKYSCGVRRAGSGEPTEFADDEISSWYGSFPLAICHALIVYLQRLRQQQKVEREAAAAVAAADPATASSAPK
jgi:hypothetical protein